MADGRVKYLRVSGRVIRDSCGGDTEFVGALTDITAAKDAEREVREREAKRKIFRYMFDEIPAKK